MISASESAPLTAFGQSTERPRQTRHGSRAVDKILASLDGRVSWDVFAVGKGTHHIFRFDPVLFSDQAALKILSESLSDRSGNCVYKTSSGIEVWAVLKTTEEANAFEEPQGLKTIKRLEATGETLFIGAQQWDEASGSAASCYKKNYTIYFKNGKALSISYDITG